ncbi:MAG: ferredoxin [Geobacteraceae bacterium]|nr:ferredoxin [Geobacteraceae bacterium]
MARIPFVDPDACISCGLCVEAAPEVFRFNDATVAEVYDPTGASEEKILEAVEGCPVGCIYWEE